MSNFSKFLEIGIMKSGMTEKQLAKISGFTRSYIALIKNGQRVSPDVDKMIKLMQALSLSPEEYNCLWQEYIKARIGDDAYERNQAVIRFVNSFNYHSEIALNCNCKYEIYDHKVLDNRLDIEYMINAVINNESMKSDDGYIRIIMQGKDNLLMKILPGICKRNQKLRIDHIICLEKYVESSMEQEQLYNAHMLKEIVPVVIFGNSRNYRVFYYYDYLTAHKHSGMLLPYMIMTSECLLCVNANMDRGMITKNPELRQLYGQVFEEHKLNCREMFKYADSLDEVITLYPGIDEIDNVTFSLSAQPCFGVLKVMGLVRKYWKKEYEAVIPFLEENLRKNETWLSDEYNKHISYCSKEGIERFVRDGVVDELPREMYHALGVRDRKRILQMLLERIQDNNYELYIMDEKMIQIPKELVVTAYGISSVLVVYMSEHIQSRIILNENSINRLVYQAFQSFKKEPQVESIQTSISLIENLISELEQME